MKKMLLCTALTMGYVGFAHAMFDDCPDKEALRAHLQARKHCLSKAAVFRADTIGKTGVCAWQTGSCMTSKGKGINPSDLSLDELLALPIFYSRAEDKSYFCKAKFKEGSGGSGFRLSIEITKNK